MSNTVSVISPKGEKFEVSIANGRDLVNNAGWEYEKPDLPTNVPPMPLPGPADATIEERLNGMEMDELREYALLNHREVLDKRFRKERMITEILKFHARDEERALLVAAAAAQEAEAAKGAEEAITTEE